MKKYLAALMAALLVCLLGITASAEEGQMSEAAAILSEALDGPEGENLSTAESVQKAKEAFEAAGWTVVEESIISPRSEGSDIDPEVLELAYMDIDEADPEMKEKILEAREKVIYSYSWVNDVDFPGGVGYNANHETKEITFDPLFSELFPGWEAPRHEFDASKVPTGVYGQREIVGEGVEAAKCFAANDVVNGLHAARGISDPAK